MRGVRKLQSCTKKWKAQCEEGSACEIVVFAKSYAKIQAVRFTLSK